MKSTETSKQEDPVILYKEIKELLIDFRKTRKKSDPWDRELEFQRNNIRSRIIHLLFAFPYSSQANMVDGYLWLDLVHALIGLYRERLAALEQKPTTPDGSRPVVQQRKLLAKFKAFLTAEETFWSGLALRVVRTFDLDEAKPALAALNITPTPDPLSGSSDQGESSGRVDVHRRSFGLGSELQKPPPPPPNQREKKVMLVYKFLLYLGDLARYREQYNENGGRPKAGHSSHHDSFKPRKGRGGRKAGPEEVTPRERDYSRAASCYNQARLLLPEVGNAFNQLAVLDTWGGDPFNSVYYCYRALCVRQPFPTAPTNLEKMLPRAIEARRKEQATNGPEQPSETESDKFKAEVVTLHGLWLLKPEANTTSTPKQIAKVNGLLRSMVESRSLTSEVIVKHLTMALGALLHIRMFTRPLPDTPNRSSQSQSLKVTSSKHSEPSILIYVLDTIRILMEIGTQELQSVERPQGTSKGGGDRSLAFAQRITAVFRRTLPALRVAAKWVKCHLEYIRRSSSPETSALPSLDSTSSTPTSIGPTAEAFWTAYARFANALTATFDTEGEECPSMSLPLEEDLDLEGFAPLKRSMFPNNRKEVDGHGADVTRSDMHPNEEQLMRIGDLLVDAKFIARSEASSLSHVDGKFLPGKARSKAEPGQVAADTPRSAHLRVVDDRGRLNTSSDDASDRPAPGDRDLDRDDDDLETASTRTDDDPVNLAMRATLDSEREDGGNEDDEQILYPVLRKSGQMQSSFLDSALVNPPAATRSLSEGRSIPTATTAEDLLAKALGSGGIQISSRASQPSSSAPSSLLDLNDRHLLPLSQGRVRQTSLAEPMALHQAPANAAAATPMLFGGSNSVWAPTAGVTSITTPKATPTKQVNRRSVPSQAYGLSQSQIGLSHHLWGPPQDIFGTTGKGSPARVGAFESTPTQPTQSTITSQQSYVGTPHLPFNPAVGSPIRPSIVQHGEQPLSDIPHRHAQMRQPPFVSVPNHPYSLADPGLFTPDHLAGRQAHMAYAPGHSTLPQGAFVSGTVPGGAWG